MRVQPAPRPNLPDSSDDSEGGLLETFRERRAREEQIGNVEAPSMTLQATMPKSAILPAEILIPSTMAEGAADFLVELGVSSTIKSMVGLDEGLAVGESVVGLDDGLAMGSAVVGLEKIHPRTPHPRPLTTRRSAASTSDCA
jgi:hypothetical protein